MERKGEKAPEEYWIFGETSVWIRRECELEDVKELGAECLRVARPCSMVSCCMAQGCEENRCWGPQWIRWRDKGARVLAEKRTWRGRRRSVT